MRIFGKIITAVLILFFLFTAPSSAEIKSMKFRSNNESMIFFAEFGFSHTGHISFEISSMSITNLSQPDPSRIGFLLLPQEHAYSFFHRFNPNPDFCLLDYKCKSVLFTFEGLLSHDESSFNKTYHVLHPGAYSLYFANCNRQSPVTIDVRTELYNMEDDGTTKDYLSVGLTQLPSLYVLFSLLYMCFLGFWIFVCFWKRQGFRRIHLIMSALLVMTIIQLMCAAADQHYVKVTGIHGFDVLFYILRFIKSVLFFNVIVLILGGWCLWEPILRKREKVVLVLVILFQVLGNGSLIFVAGDTRAVYNEHWFIYDVGYIFFDLYSCIVIFTPIVLEENPEVNKAANSFGIVAFVYVIFTRIIVGGILTQGLVYKCPWVINVVYESSSLVFCMVMFSMFEPSVLEDDDEEGGRMRLLDDQELGLQTSESWILSCISGSYYI